jgi:hypothetical protein
MNAQENIQCDQSNFGRCYIDLDPEYLLERTQRPMRSERNIMD